MHNDPANTAAHLTPKVTKVTVATALTVVVSIAGTTHTTTITSGALGGDIDPARYIEFAEKMEALIKEYADPIPF